MKIYKEEEVCFYRGTKKIYGKLYLPEKNGPLPLVIMEHGFGGNLTLMENYARSFSENGFAVYAFDFAGGGVLSRSDGKMTEMSVLTEAADLNTVIDGLKDRNEFDPENIFLFGGSQGGFVATYVASARPSDIRALVVLYPAYVLQDDAADLSMNSTVSVNGKEYPISAISNVMRASDALDERQMQVYAIEPNDMVYAVSSETTLADGSYSARIIMAKLRPAELVLN